MIGRRIEILADLDRVRVLTEGRVVADHDRVWAWHQTITDPAHLAAAKVLRQTRVGVLRPVHEAEVELRALADYGLITKQGVATALARRGLGRGRGLPMMGVLTPPSWKTSTCLTLPLMRCSLALT